MLGESGVYTHLFTLKIFCSVVEKGSIVKASEDLLLTQPAVSLQIKNLENLYDTRFFDRTPKGLKINKHGEILYGYAKKLIDFHSEMYENIVKRTHAEQTELRIAASTIPGIYFLPPILRRYKKVFSPKFHFEVSETDKILSDLTERKVDVVIVSHMGATDGIQYEKLLCHPLVLVSRKDYTRRKDQQVSLKDLKGEDIILMKQECDITKSWKHFLDRHHIKQGHFHLSGVFDHISFIIRFLKEEDGLGLLPQCMVSKEIREGVLKQVYIKERGLQMVFYLAFQSASMQDERVYQFYKFLKSFPFKEILW